MVAVGLGFALWSLPARRAPHEHEQPAPGARALADQAAPVMSAKAEPVADGARVLSTSAPEHGGVPVLDLTGMVVQLTAEEQQIVEQYAATGLGAAIAEAQNAYLTASPAARDEADRKYLLITNLAAKLTPVASAPPSALMRERMAAYQRALPAETLRLAQLPEAERDDALSAFKDSFFADLEAPLPSGSGPEGDIHVESK